MTYSDLKVLIEQFTGLERDALHIHAALFLYILAMGLFRQSRRSRFPWLFVFAIECANEVYDLWHNWADGIEYAVTGSLKDLWNTMLWPTVLLFVGRYTDWFQKPRPPIVTDLPCGPEQVAEARNGAA